MPYTDPAKNLMLDSLDAVGGILFVSAHTAFPGNTGANEVAGGTYARQSITWDAAAVGNLNSANTPIIPIPGTNTVVWIGFFSLVTAGVFHAYSPLNADPKFYSVVLATEVFTSLAHGFVNDDKVVFYNGVVPGGLVEGTEVFIITATTDTFQVSLTSGGVAIDITSIGADTVRVSKVVPETFGSDGNLTVSDADLNLNL